MPQKGCPKEADAGGEFRVGFVLLLEKLFSAAMAAVRLDAALWLAPVRTAILQI